MNGFVSIGKLHLLIPSHDSPEESHNVSINYYPLFRKAILSKANLSPLVIKLVLSNLPIPTCQKQSPPSSLWLRTVYVNSPKNDFVQQ